MGEEEPNREIYEHRRNCQWADVVFPVAILGPLEHRSRQGRTEEPSRIRLPDESDREVPTSEYTQDHA